MSRRFLPVREAELNDWLANFAGQISAAPDAYGLSGADAAVIAAAVAGWHAAFQTAVAPTTRTASAVIAKRQARRAVTAVVRRFAARIRSNDTIDAALKLGLGLIVRGRAGPDGEGMGGTMRGAPVPVPGSRPVLTMRLMRPGEQQLRATDAASRGRGKPAGVAALVVFRTVAEGAMLRPTDGAGAEYLGVFTRPSFSSAFTRADRGKVATYFARWMNTKGQPGPWSQGLSIAIAA